MAEESSDDNLTIMSNLTRLRLFYKIYQKTILFITIPLILMPIAFIGENNAYLSFYSFLITVAYWIFNVLHPAIVSFIPMALTTIMHYFGYEIILSINIWHTLLDCFGIMIFIVAIENSNIHKRIGLKILLIFGCSHYRLCFLLFFSTMLLSMWISNTLACGFMIPIVKSILFELEKMGIIEVFETTEKTKQSERDEGNPRPTDFTIFYVLGIAYSSSIGGMATLVGSRTNYILKTYSETLFPLAPKIEFPQFMLLTLPAVLVLETCLYLWMNFYFLGLFRIHNYSALHTDSTPEEAQYVTTLLSIQYQKLKKITIKEIVVGCTILLCVILQMTSSVYLSIHDHLSGHHTLSAPTIVCVVVLCVAPSNMDFLKFFNKHNDHLPSTPSEPCLDWKTVKKEINWSVLLLLGSSCAMFEALKHSKMTVEFERFLLLCSGWPAALLLAVLVCCKLLTELASNVCVARCMLGHVARVSVVSQVNPHSLLLAGALASSLPFHLATGTPANAMVAAYFHIPPTTMMYAGAGPTVFSILVIWFTVVVWAEAIWTGIGEFPEWANITNFNIIE